MLGEEVDPSKLKCKIALTGRWRIELRWRGCFSSGWSYCSSHSKYLYIIEIVHYNSS